LLNLTFKKKPKKTGELEKIKIHSAGGHKINKIGLFKWSFQIINIDVEGVCVYVPYGWHLGMQALDIYQLQEKIVCREFVAEKL
jgi:hypothetical protein